MNHTGQKLSDYPMMPVTTSEFPNKIALDTYLFSYGYSVYGTKFVKRNYQIPLGVLRKDIAGFIGVSNSKAHWRNDLRFWSGWWNNNDKRLAYVYEWEAAESGDVDYIENKFGEEEGIDKVFLLKSAPIPLEENDTRVNDAKTVGTDPAPNATKIVDKKYIDARFEGIRRVNIEKGSGVIPLRPYPCYYYIEHQLPYNEEGDYHFINIDTKTNGVDKAMKFNRMSFYLKFREIADYSEHDFKILVDGEDIGKWVDSYGMEGIIKERRLFNGYYLLKLDIESEEVSEETYNVSVHIFNCVGDKKGVLIPLEYGTETASVKLAKNLNNAFITRIGEDASSGAIGFNTDALRRDTEYKWNFYIETPDRFNTIVVPAPNEDEGVRNEYHIEWDEKILWAMEDFCNTPPELKPKKLYCLNFTHIADTDYIIGRIEYFVNLVKKS